MECMLKLDALVFDSIEFKRLGMRNNNAPEISFSVSIGTNKSEINEKRVTVKMVGVKKDEYNLCIQATGYFSFDGNSDDVIIRQNAVAIMLPYIRSEVTLITAQPGVEPVVLPPLNVAAMMEC